jgi:hypothetical protein
MAHIDSSKKLRSLVGYMENGLGAESSRPLRNVDSIRKKVSRLRELHTPSHGDTVIYILTASDATIMWIQLSTN